jgi:predicted dehydrogenase
MSKKLGLAVTGLHEGLTMLIAPDRKGMECEHVTVVAGCDTDPAKIDRARRVRPDLAYYDDYAELLKDASVDIVAIYTPDSSHGGLIEAAMDSGKHVICTKPVVNSVEDAQRVKRALDRTGKLLLVGQSTRFFESVRRQREDYENGQIGELEFVDAHYIHRMDWFYEKSPWAATTTDWVFLGLSHPVDLLVWYLGPIREVYAQGRQSALAKHYDARGFDIYSVNVEAENGQIGRCMGNYGVHELPSARNAIELMLYGDAGSSLSQYHDMRYLRTDESGVEHKEDHLYAKRTYYFNDDVHGKHFGEFANYAEYFARSIVEGSPYSPDGAEGLYTFGVMEAIRRSAEQRRALRVPEVLEEMGL